MFSIKLTRNDDGTLASETLIDGKEPTEDQHISYSAMLALLREATFNIEASLIAESVIGLEQKIAREMQERAIGSKLIGDK